MIRQVQQNLNGPMNNGKIASGVHANGIARNVSTKPTAKAKGKSKAKARPKTRSKKNTTMSVVQSTHANIRVSSQAHNSIPPFTAISAANVPSNRNIGNRLMSVPTPQMNKQASLLDSILQGGNNCDNINSGSTMSQQNVPSMMSQGQSSQARRGANLLMSQPSRGGANLVFSQQARFP